ncbi:hypothetical protein V493_03575, partial [Pseudogymnoascus sp. VKM F-4281 (FW-2241)]
MTLQPRVPADQPPEEGLRDSLGARRRRMRVVSRVVRHHGRVPQRLVAVRNKEAVVDKLAARSGCRGLGHGVEAPRAVAPRAGLPDIVRLREHSLRLAAVVCGARLLAGAGAGRAPIVIGEGAAVVVPELDDDVVPALRSVDDLREAALAREGARGTPADGLVNHGDGDE